MNLEAPLRWSLDNIAAYMMDCVFSPDGKLLACCGADEDAIWLRDIVDGRAHTTLRAHRSAVMAVCFTPSGEVLASGSEDATIAIWDLLRQVTIKVITIPGSPITTLRFDPHGRFLVSGGADGSARVWDSADWRQTTAFFHHSGRVSAVALDWTGNRLATGGDDTHVHLWDTQAGVSISKLRGHERPITALSFASNRTSLLSGSSDGTVRVWDVSSGEERTVLGPFDGAVWALTSHPWLPLVAIGLFRGQQRILICDWTSGAIVAHLDPGSEEINALAFNAEGTSLACCSNGKASVVAVWDMGFAES